MRVAAPRSGGAFLFPQPWHAVPMRALAVTLCLLATPAPAGAAQVLGPDHGVTKALAKAAITMGRADMWKARLAIKTLRRDQREAIAEAAESRHGQHHLPLPGGGLADAIMPHRKTCGN